MENKDNDDDDVDDNGLEPITPSAQRRLRNLRRPIPLLSLQELVQMFGAGPALSRRRRF